MQTNFFSNKFLEAIWKKVTKYNLAPTTIGRSKDVDDSSNLSQVITKKLELIIIPLNRNKLS